MRDGIRAAHRVIASYAVKDPEERIRLLASARAIDPECFNALNGMGYAYLEMGKTAEAIDAFSLAVHAFPQDKAGYCDLAYAYKVAGETDLCLKYLRRAVEVDASARDDVARDPRFADVRDGV
ncbi:MAG: tetratricopeptide repeat protein [Desulfovibrio sp.]|jgi:tetratricopeptide (TPR) repeat protein|nr:tetratricopeptide repeat protein [Desulfovibrio sp.]